MLLCVSIEHDELCNTSNTCFLAEIRLKKDETVHTHTHTLCKFNVYNFCYSEKGARV